MIRPVLAAISFTSFLLLLLLGMKLVHEESRKRGNRYFAAYIFWIAGISFSEFMARMSESIRFAEFWGYCASLWPFSGALLIHSLVLMLNDRDRTGTVLAWFVYPVATAMSIGYASYVASGNAVVQQYGYSLTSADPLQMPHGIITITQSFLMIAVFALLVRGGWDRRQQFLRRRDLRWILAAFTVYLGVLVVGRLVGMPEMTGLSYLGLGGTLFFGVHKGYLPILTPHSASRQILGSISELLLLTDPKYRIISANQAAVTFFGRSESELVGTYVTAFDPLRGDPAQGEICSNDGARWIRLRETAVETRRGVLMGRMLLGRDITDERRHTALLQRSLAEKESLLREIHHRSYNTLQLISSILELKSAGLEDPAGQRVIMECNDRIRAIAAVYEPVWEEKDTAHIELGELLRLQVQDSVSREAFLGHAEIVYELDRLEVGLQQAVNISLIVAELVSNVAHHAFPDSGAGTLWIRLSVDSPGNWSLSVADNGCGFPVDDFSVGGLEIARLLCEELGSELEIESGESGTRIGFTINAKSE